MDCLFCKIIQKEIPAEIIYEDEGILAFLDIHPCTAGHTLVLPKNHCRNILDLTEEETGLIFKAVRRVALLLKKSLGPAGFTIGINQGRSSGQLVDHLHIHIIPRFENDGGGSIHSIVNQPPQASLNEIKNKILNVEKQDIV